MIKSIIIWLGKLLTVVIKDIKDSRFIEIDTRHQRKIRKQKIEQEDHWKAKRILKSIRQRY